MASLRFVACGLALGLCLAAPAAAQCVLVRERNAPDFAPHIALHFGTPAEVPVAIQCATSLDKNLPTLCIPIYAYNLREGARGFEFAIRTPRAPIGFDRGEAIVLLELRIDEGPEGATTSLRLSADRAVCGPALIGCLRLPTADLPENFGITMMDHTMAGRCAVQSPDGTWHEASVDRGGAWVGSGAQCPGEPCGANTPIDDLRVAHGTRPGVLSLSWRNGSGSFTLLRYRTDGRAPADPWDGELLAFLPSTVTQYSYSLSVPGDVRIAAWSITRGPFGIYHAASSLECGALASILVQLPVAVAPTDWARVKTLYR
jgi:hypothetical protein